MIKNLYTKKVKPSINISVRNMVRPPTPKDVFPIANGIKTIINTSHHAPGPLAEYFPAIITGMVHKSTFSYDAIRAFNHNAKIYVPQQYNLSTTTSISNSGILSPVKAAVPLKQFAFKRIQAICGHRVNKCSSWKSF